MNVENGAALKHFRKEKKTMDKEKTPRGCIAIITGPNGAVWEIGTCFDNHTSDRMAEIRSGERALINFAKNSMAPPLRNSITSSLAHTLWDIARDAGFTMSKQWIGKEDNG